MEYFYYSSDNYLCVKEEYRQKSYRLNEINLLAVPNIDDLIKEIQEIYQNSIENKSACIYPLKKVVIYDLFYSSNNVIFFHNIRNSNFIDKLVKIGFQVDLIKTEMEKFKKSKNYKNLSDEVKLMLELE